jgi:hypothetical protein
VSKTYQPGIDVVTVDFKTPLLLDQFCRSLTENPPSVDWGATIGLVCPGPDDSRAAIYWAQTSILRAKAWGENIGYARAVNALASKGKRETLAIFNADVIIHPGVLDHCHAELHAHHNWGVVGPRQVDDEDRITHAGIFGQPLNRYERGWHEPASDGRYNGVVEALSVSGSAYFIKRLVWDQLTECDLYQKVAPGAEGAFLPTPHYLEETACSLHAKSHGYRVIFDGRVTLTHLWHQSSPVGGWAEQQMPKSEALFGEFCAAHNISGC